MAKRVIDFIEIMSEDRLDGPVIGEVIGVLEALVFDLKLGRRDILHKVIVALDTLQGFCLIIVDLFVDTLVIVLEPICVRPSSALIL